MTHPGFPLLLLVYIIPHKCHKDELFLSLLAIEGILNEINCFYLTSLNKEKHKKSAKPAMES